MSATRGVQIMLKQRMAAVEAVTERFRKAEATSDQVAAETAEAIAEFLRARQRSGVPLGTGRAMLRKMVAALVSNIEARDSLIDAHEMTPEVIESMGLTRMWGDGSPCPPDAREAFLGSSEVRPLRAA